MGRKGQETVENRKRQGKCCGQLCQELSGALEAGYALREADTNLNPMERFMGQAEDCRSAAALPAKPGFPKGTAGTSAQRAGGPERTTIQCW
jgi:hypothetical protein